MLSKTRRKRSKRSSPTIITNEFSRIAPIWFYSLVSNFIKKKDSDVLWSGSTGNHFLANLFRTLAAIVEFSGIHASQVLAMDLLDLVWQFRAADIAEVRLSVLISLATAVAMIPPEKLQPVLRERNRSIPDAISDMATTDPDQHCRSIAQAISTSVVDMARDPLMNELIE